MLFLNSSNGCHSFLLEILCCFSCWLEKFIVAIDVVRTDTYAHIDVGLLVSDEVVLEMLM